MRLKRGSVAIYQALIGFVYKCEAPVVSRFPSQIFLMSYNLHLFLNLVKIQTSHSSLFAIDDLGQLLECRALGFNIHEVDENKLERNPAL